ncbi:MAG: HEAT repeat domain-containing protein, partial [Gemmataceae bacterium]|nr:HEAT repeat domain-containing protein [Gemmataceae bacterium]
MSLDHLASAALILATLVVVAAAGGALYYLGVVAWAVGLFGKVVKWSVAAGFATWQATLSWADWRTAGALIAVLLTLGYVSHASGAPLVAVPVAALLLAIGLVACLAFMYLSFERYEVARGYKAVHNPIKGQELAVDVARYGDRVGVMLLIVAAVGTVMGFAQLNHALYVSFGHGWYRFESADEDATFLDFLAYTLVHLLRVVDVLDLAGTYTEVRVNVLRPGKWPATTLLLGFKSFFTLLLLQQVFAGVREGKLLSETVTDFWSPHAPIHDRARFALPQFGPSSVGAIIRSLRALGPITKEQRDRLPDVFAAMGPAVIPELIRHAADDHELTRAVVAKALGLLHTPDAVEPLIVLTADPSEPVRAAAVAGLGEIAAGLGHRKDRRAAVPCRGKWRVARVLRKLKIKIPLPADSAPVAIPALTAAQRTALEKEIADTKKKLADSTDR